MFVLRAHRYFFVCCLRVGVAVGYGRAPCATQKVTNCAHLRPCYTSEPANTIFRATPYHVIVTRCD